MSCAPACTIGDVLLRKRRLEENDEAPYAEMNARFHGLIQHEAGSVILSEALERNSRVPFAGPQALAFDRTNLERMYEVLFQAHRQHHGIVEALEHGESGRVEALMREHANSPKESLNLSGFHMAPAQAVRRLRSRQVKL